MDNNISPYYVVQHSIKQWIDQSLIHGTILQRVAYLLSRRSPTLWYTNKWFTKSMLLFCNVDTYHLPAAVHLQLWHCVIGRLAMWTLERVIHLRWSINMRACCTSSTVTAGFSLPSPYQWLVVRLHMYLPFVWVHPQRRNTTSLSEHVQEWLLQSLGKHMFS